MLKCLRVILGFSTLIISAYSGIFLHVVPLVGLTIINSKLAYSWVNAVVIKWFQLAELILTLLFRIRIRTFGDRMDKNSFLFISNHRCRLDWFFTMALGQSVYDMKYSMKDPLKHVPFLGWAMQFSFFIFLKRDINQDRQRIANILQLIQAISHNGDMKMLFYPEGSDLSPSNLERNKKYAEKVGKKATEHVLLPRLTGFKEILKTLHEIKTPEVIYDVTIAYPKNIAQSEKDLFLGAYPEEVQFLIKEYKYIDLPFIMGLNGEGLDEEGAANWLENLWIEKEACLKQFYELPRDERIFSGKKEYFLENAGFNSQTNLATTRGSGVLVFWLLTVVAHVFLFVNFAFAKFYFILMPIAFFFVDIFYDDGITGLFQRLYSIKSKKENK